MERNFELNTLTVLGLSPSPFLRTSIDIDGFCFGFSSSFLSFSDFDFFGILPNFSTLCGLILSKVALSFSACFSLLSFSLVFIEPFERCSFSLSRSRDDDFLCLSRWRSLSRSLSRSRLLLLWLLWLELLWLLRCFLSSFLLFSSVDDDLSFVVDDFFSSFSFSFSLSFSTLTSTSVFTSGLISVFISFSTLMSMSASIFLIICFPSRTETL